MLTVSVRDHPRRTFTCEALLFDMDGTLVDSRECVERTWRDWCVRHRLDCDELLRLSHGRQNHDTIRMVAPHLQTDEELALLARAEEECRDGVVAVRGAARLLGGLAPRHWAVVTSAWRRLAEIRLGLAGLPVPPVLVTADEIRRGKPDPEGYLSAADHLGVDPAACVVVEDAPAGVEAGRAAGMHVIGVTTTFGPGLAGCEWYIDDFDALTVRASEDP
ncbi:HAD-IA family hydrolase [Streptosporangium sp. NPDC051022]|uniref:HAD-IA family hydrolase n=1 Tax=Streptosporangium sp. NPDC051022 TaxID=3155752 RepID=UPI003445EAB7